MQNVSYRDYFQRVCKKFRAQAASEEDIEFKVPRAYHVTEVGIDMADGEITVSSSLYSNLYIELFIIIIYRVVYYIHTLQYCSSYKISNVYKYHMKIYIYHFTLQYFQHFQS